MIFLNSFTLILIYQDLTKIKKPNRILYINNNLSHNFFPLFWGVFGFQLIESTIWYITIESGSSDAV